MVTRKAAERSQDQADVSVIHLHKSSMLRLPLTPRCPAPTQRGILCNWKQCPHMQIPSVSQNTVDPQQRGLELRGSTSMHCFTSICSWNCTAISTI